MPTTARFRIAPLAADYASRIRTTRRDAFGHAVQERRDEDQHQCRVCLTLSAPYEPCLLLRCSSMPAAHAGKRKVEEVIGELLADPQVAYVHARNDTYGCYMFRVDRL